MVSVLIVDDDMHLGRALVRALDANGFRAEAVGGYEAALARLQERSHDVLLTDLRLGDRDGLELLQEVRDGWVNTRSILMSAHASARDSQRALDLGAIRVLNKPFETRDVVEAIERAVDSATGYVGTVHGLSLIDMLQMFHYGRRSLTVELLGKVGATLSMREGEIVDARHGLESGEAALRAILRLPAGSLRTRSLQPVAPSISREFQGLLLDLLRELDEQSSPDSEPPTSRGGSKKARRRGRPRRPSRAELDGCCQAVAENVQGAVACEVLDVRTGKVLGAFCARDAVDGPARLPAAPLLQLFRGTLQAPSSTGAAAAPTGAQFEEFQLTSQDEIHLAKSLRPHRAIVVLAARRAANVALGWAQLRSALCPLAEAFEAAASAPELEAAPPVDGAAAAAHAAPGADTAERSGPEGEPRALGPVRTLEAKHAVAVLDDAPL